jgi:hypothetical protein
MKYKQSKPSGIVPKASDLKKPEMLSYQKLKALDLEKELETDKKLIEMTTGAEDGEDSAASDSEPSEDNLEEAEMAKIIPTKAKPVVEKKKPVKAPAIKPTIPVKRYEEKSPTAA